MLIWNKKGHPPKEDWDKLPNTAALAKKNGSRFFYNSTRNKKTGIICIRYTDNGGAVEPLKEHMPVHKELVKEWHPSKNGEKKPEDFTRHSTVIIWWLCKNGREWEQSIDSRTRDDKYRRCACCTGRIATPKNNLAISSPELAKEWHPIRNGEKKPEDYTIKSNKKIFWICSKSHVWPATIANRSRGDGCPKCSPIGTSRSELRIYYECKKIFGNVIHRHKIKKTEIDIYLPDLNFAIEFDGRLWHKDLTKDIKHNKIIIGENINIIRIRDKGLSRINHTDIMETETIDKSTMDKIVKIIYQYSDDETRDKITNYINLKSFINQNEYSEHAINFSKPVYENSLEYHFPKLAQEWHHHKNHSLKPSDFSQKSAQKVWWLCSNGHEWEQIIHVRTSTEGGAICPYCNHSRVSPEYNLEVLYPNLAKEWNYVNNENIRPSQIMPYTDKKFSWRCKKGHVWSSSPNKRLMLKDKKRRIVPCPYCSGNQNKLKK